MNIIGTRYASGKTILMLCVVQVITACLHVQQAMSPPDLHYAYSQAIKDAEVAQYDEISRNLVAIVPSNDALRWNNDYGEVLVATWTSWDGYDDRVRSTMTLSREVWVTAVPEVKAFCREQHITPAQIALRLEQLLGLPPASEKTKFVEMWADPNDLFRPSPDPEVSDHEAELDFPVSHQFVTVSEPHRQWFRELKKKSYGQQGYPWTRLGYTYDWGNPSSEIGVSEFVVRGGATVRIHAVTATLDYCR